MLVHYADFSESLLPLAHIKRPMSNREKKIKLKEEYSAEFDAALVLIWKGTVDKIKYRIPPCHKYKIGEIDRKTSLCRATVSMTIYLASNHHYWGQRLPKTLHAVPAVVPKCCTCPLNSIHEPYQCLHTHFSPSDRHRMIVGRKSQGMTTFVQSSGLLPRMETGPASLLVFQTSLLKQPLEAKLIGESYETLIQVTRNLQGC